MAAKLFQMILIKQSTEGTLRMHFHSAIYNCCGQSKKITGLFRCRSVPLIKILQLSSNCNELTYLISYYHTHQLCAHSHSEGTAPARKNYDPRTYNQTREDAMADPSSLRPPVFTFTNQTYTHRRRSFDQCFFKVTMPSFFPPNEPLKL